MASYITYTEKTSFTYNSQTYDHSLALQFTNYKLDKFGRKVNAGNDDLQVRSYYKVSGVDSAVNGMPLTIEDLVTLLAVKRANGLEKEITPMAKIIETRNKRIEDLGTLLASIAKTQSQLESQGEDHNDSYACIGLCYYLKLYFTSTELSEANLLTWVNQDSNSSQTAECKSKKSDGYIASANQLVKAKIDSLNNDAQSDLSRMDNLVSKRDEAYTLSTDLLGKFSDGRSNILNNIK